MRLTALDSRLGGQGSSVAALDDRVTALDGRVDHLSERLKDGLGTAFEGSAMAMGMSGGSLPADKDFGLTLNWGRSRESMPSPAPHRRGSATASCFTAASASARTAAPSEPGPA